MNPRLQTIDIEDNINNMELINMSNLISDIKYIPLENVEGIPLTAFSDFDVSAHLIIKTDMNECLLFDNSGSLVRKFGKSGRGPKEYSYVANLNLWNDNKVYFTSSRNLFEYNINDSSLQRFDNTFLVDNEFYVTMFCPFNDSLFFGHIPNYSGQIRYKAVLFNKYGHSKQTFKNYIFFPLTKPQSIGSERTAYFHRFENKVFYHDLYNDTLFYLDEKYQLDAKYVFNLGKFKQPTLERTNSSLDKVNKYVSVGTVMQTKNHLFINCNFGEHFPAKRFTPAKKQVPNSMYLMHNTTICLGVYDKSKRKLIFCKPTSTDNPLFTTGLYNDIDGGPRFLPMKSINDSTMVMWIDPKQLKDHISSEDFKNSNPKFPEKKLLLENLANDLSDFSNPVLMKVTFKK